MGLRKQVRSEDDMKVVYIAGPFRGPTNWDIERNIRQAQKLALGVWRLGAAALCPHTNAGLCFRGAASDGVWLDGCIELLKRCDGVLFHPEWRRSEGSQSIYDVALYIGIRRFETHQITDDAARLAAARSLDHECRLGDWLGAAL